MMLFAIAAVCGLISGQAAKTVPPQSPWAIAHVRKVVLDGLIQSLNPAYSEEIVAGVGTGLSLINPRSGRVKKIVSGLNFGAEYVGGIVGKSVLICGEFGVFDVDVATGTLRTVLDAVRLDPDGLLISQDTFASPNRKWLALLGPNGEVSTYRNLPTGPMLRTVRLRTQQDARSVVALVNRRLAITAFSKVWILDLERNAFRTIPIGYDVVSLDWDATEDRLVLVGLTLATRVDARTGRRLSTVRVGEPQHPIQRALYSPRKRGIWLVSSESIGFLADGLKSVVRVGAGVGPFPNVVVECRDRDELAIAEGRNVYFCRLVRRPVSSRPRSK